LVVGFAGQVTGVNVALPSGFFGGLGELPIVEARAETGPDGLVLFGPAVVAEAVVGQAQRLGQHPFLAAVLVAERLDPCCHVAAARSDVLLEIVEGDDGKNGQSVLRAMILVNAPKALGIQSLCELFTPQLGQREIAPADNPTEVGDRWAESGGNSSIVQRVRPSGAGPHASAIHFASLLPVKDRLHAGPLLLLAHQAHLQSFLHEPPTQQTKALLGRRAA